MLRPQVTFLVALFLFPISSVYGENAVPLPVFGILSQPYTSEDDSNNLSQHEENSTYVAASYVKWLEDGGARSIPIPFDASPTLVRSILEQVDGVLFPGGGSSLPSSAITIWNELHSQKYYYPVEDNAVADRIPLWGTCLGMEFIVQLAADAMEQECDNSCNRSILESGYDSTNISLPLLDVVRTDLYRPDSIYDIVTKYNVTMNNHHLGISPKRFKGNPGLSRRFVATSVNYDRNGKAFVSTIEPLKQKVTNEASSSLLSSMAYLPPPVYGVQYHPEKNSHEYGLSPNTSIPYEAIDHTPEGIAFSLYEAQFLVNLARDNILARRQRGSDRGDNKYETNKYNRPDLYPMIYTYPRKVGYKFEEIYIIPPASHWENKIKNKNENDHDVEEIRDGLLNRDREVTISMLRRKPKDPKH